MHLLVILILSSALVVNKPGKLCIFSSKFASLKSNLQKLLPQYMFLGECYNYSQMHFWGDKHLGFHFPPGGCQWLKETNWISLLPLLLHCICGCWPACQSLRCPQQKLVRGLKQFLNSKGTSFAKRFMQVKRIIQPTQSLQIRLLGLPWCFLENSVTCLEATSNPRYNLAGS